MIFIFRNRSNTKTLRHEKRELNPFQNGLLYFNQFNDRYKHVNPKTTKTVRFYSGQQFPHFFIQSLDEMLLLRHL